MTITLELGGLLALGGILVGWGLGWGLMRGELNTLNRLITQWREADDAIHHDHESRLRALERGIGA